MSEGHHTEVAMMTEDADHIVEVQDADQDPEAMTKGIAHGPEVMTGGGHDPKVMTEKRVTKKKKNDQGAGAVVLTQDLEAGQDPTGQTGQGHTVVPGQGQRVVEIEGMRKKQEVEVEHQKEIKQRNSFLDRLAYEQSVFMQ